MNAYMHTNISFVCLSTYVHMNVMNIYDELIALISPWVLWPVCFCERALRQCAFLPPVHSCYFFIHNGINNKTERQYNHIYL